MGHGEGAVAWGPWEPAGACEGSSLPAAVHTLPREPDTTGHLLTYDWHSYGAPVPYSCAAGSPGMQGGRGADLGASTVALCQGPLPPHPCVRPRASCTTEPGVPGLVPPSLTGL